MSKEVRIKSTVDGPPHEILLEDGTRLTTRLVVMRVIDLETIGPDGQPTYNIDAQLVVRVEKAADGAELAKTRAAQNSLINDMGTQKNAFPNDLPYDKRKLS